MSNSAMTKKAIAIAFAIILAFTGGYLLGASGNAALNISVNHNGTADTNAQQAVAPVTAAPVTAAPVTEAPAAVADTTAAPAADETPAVADTSADDTETATTKAPKADNDAAATTKASSKAPSGKEEIVKYFTTSANKIKSGGAKSVTRNYEDLQHNEDKLVVPGILQGIGKTLISTFLKKNETPVTWEGADINANYPVQGTSTVSSAKASDVKDATCTDDGKYYNITLYFIDETDPTSTGVATSFNIIRAEDVKAAAKVVSSFSSDYYNAKIECKIDKATGNMVSANYTLPIVMHVKAMGVDAQVGMTFINDYTINY